MMRHLSLVLGALLLTAQTLPQTPVASAPLAAPALDPTRVAGVLDAAGLAGTVLIGKGDQIVYERAFGPVDPAGGPPHALGRLWRWASVTKQVTATIAMQEVAAGRLDLDTPIKAYLPASRAPFADRITARMLMQHISGVPRTEDSPIGADGWQSFYLVPPGDPATGIQWCEGPTDRAPPAEFRYGDCDFILMGAVLEAITGTSYRDLIRDRIAKPLKLESLGLFPRTAPTVDRALLTGKLLPEAQRATMWTGDPKLGYAAFGQWAFSAPIKGCGPAAVRFVERRGAIGGVVLRNIILPEYDMVLIMTANRAEADAAFGEIWQQKGISHDVLSAILCPRGAA